MTFRTPPLFASPLQTLPHQTSLRASPLRCAPHYTAHRRRPRCSRRLSPTATLLRIRPEIPAAVVRGADAALFVNNMGTNAFSADRPEPLQTVFTGPTGRIVDVVSTIPREDASVLLLSSLGDGALAAYLDRYVFPSDDVTVEATSVRGVDVLGGDPASLEGTVAPALFGATVLTDHEGAAGVTGDVCEQEVWERECTWNGVPRVGIELTGDYNPLEAGLWHCVSFEKGCYIGQETIARLNTYDGVRRRLCLVQFEGPVAAGAALEPVGGEERAGGVVTSVCEREGVFRALAYVRRRGGAAKPDGRVRVDGVSGTILKTSFLKYGFEERSLLTL